MNLDLVWHQKALAEVDLSCFPLSSVATSELLMDKEYNPKNAYLREYALLNKNGTDFWITMQNIALQMSRKRGSCDEEEGVGKIVPPLASADISMYWQKGGSWYETIRNYHHYQPHFIVSLYFCFPFGCNMIIFSLSSMF